MTEELGKGSGNGGAPHVFGEEVLRGRAWCFGDHIDTDAIIPARRCNSADPRVLAKFCMEDADPGFAEAVQPGDIIVGGENFGCGSSREVAPIAIKAAGVGAVVARSYARIFFRNAINIGLPIFECKDHQIEPGDEVEIDPPSGRIKNLTQGTEFQAVSFPPFLQRIIGAGGLHRYVQQRLWEAAAAAGNDDSGAAGVATSAAASAAPAGMGPRSGPGSGSAAVG